MLKPGSVIARTSSFLSLASWPIAKQRPTISLLNETMLILLSIAVSYHLNSRHKSSQILHIPQCDTVEEAQWYSVTYCQM